MNTKEINLISTGDVIAGEYISVMINSVYEGQGSMLAQILVEAQY